MGDAEIQLLNDLVKVGVPVLGAILGGVVGATSTYLVTKLNHSNERNKVVLQRRLDLVLQTANDVAEFEHLASMYAVAVNNKIRGLQSSVDIEDARYALVNKNQPLRRARMTLKVLGLIEAESLLEEYTQVTRELFSIGLNNSASRAAELTDVIGKGPIRFYLSLSTEFPVVSAR